jgi:hypothetical protein
MAVNFLTQSFLLRFLWVTQFFLVVEVLLPTMFRTVKILYCIDNYIPYCTKLTSRKYFRNSTN